MISHVRRRVFTEQRMAVLLRRQNRKEIAIHLGENRPTEANKAFQKSNHDTPIGREVPHAEQDKEVV